MKTLGDSFMFLEIILSMKYTKNTGGRFRGVKTAGKQSMNQLNMMRQGKANQPYSMRQRAIKIKQ